MPEITLTKPQSEFLRLDCPFPLFVGGFGSGKTQAGIISEVQDYVTNPGANIAVYAPKFDDLKLNFIPRTMELLGEMGLKPTYNGSDYWIRCQGLGSIYFRSMNNPGGIVGYEVFRSHIDEIDTMPDAKAEEAWQKIIARNRQKVPGPDGNFLKNRTSVYTTPEGFNFTYRRWSRAPSKGYEYVRAPTRSNAANLPEDYIDTLRDSYPANIVEAYLDGQWVNLTTGAIFPEFDRKENSCDSVVEPGEPIMIGMDFNITKMAAAIFVVRGDVPHAVGELVDLDNTPEMIRAIKERYGDASGLTARRSITIFPDASGAHRDTRGENPTESDITLLRKAGFSINGPRANPLRRDRFMAANALIRSEGLGRRLFVNVDACPRITESFEQSVYKDNGQPDDTDLSHIRDAATYPLHRRWPVTRKEFTHLPLGSLNNAR